MTKLAQAQARFSAALDALDRAIEDSGVTMRLGSKLKVEMSALKSERETLYSRIAALEEETRVLAGLTEEVEDRLDDAIAEIREVLAHNLALTRSSEAEKWRMPLVDVMVNGREYQIACDAGQEDRLRDLGQMFDKRVQALAKSVGQVGDARLLLMAGLVLADELSNATAKASDREKEVELLKARFADGTVTLEKTESELSALLEQAAIRIESIAARVAAP